MDRRPAGSREKSTDSYERLEERLSAMGIMPETRMLRGETERSIVATIAGRDHALLEPEKFPIAHRRLARGLEAVALNGRESVTLSPRLGLLRPLLNSPVHLLVNSLLAQQSNQVHKSVRSLYAFREANAVWNSPEHVLLRRARMQMDTIGDGIGAGRFGLPVFLLSGAFLSALLSGLRAVLAPALHSRWLTLVVLIILVVLLISIAVVTLQAASIAKLRLRMALRGPVKSVYRTLGSAAPPPRDRCFLVAFSALVLFALAGVAVPFGLLFLFSI